MSIEIIRHCLAFCHMNTRDSVRNAIHFKATRRLLRVHLQVIDSPESEYDGQYHAAETENQDWRVSAV